MVYGVCVVDDAAEFSLAEYDVEPYEGDFSRGDEVVEDIAGTDGGELVDVADEDEMGFAGDGLDEAGGESRVEHGGFVDYYDVGTEWFRFVYREGSFGGIEF